MCVGKQKCISQSLHMYFEKLKKNYKKIFQDDKFLQAKIKLEFFFFF